MAVKLLFCVVCLLALSQVQGLEINSDGKIKMTIVTSPFCTDAVNFYANHFIEAYRLYSNFLDIEFVAWGRTNWDGVGEITCTMGVRDCWANRVHRCALNMLKGNQAAQMDYMTCEFTSRYAFVHGTYSCATNMGLNLAHLDYCVANDRDDLDRAAQARSNPIMEVINFVPSIVFNDNIDTDVSHESRARLVEMICQALVKHPGSGIAQC